MTAARRFYAVTVTLQAPDSTTALLSLVSVLHRRAVEVGRAELSTASHGRRTFSATFMAADRQAATIRASLDRLIDVLDVVLDATPDAAWLGAGVPSGASE